MPALGRQRNEPAGAPRGGRKALEQQVSRAVGSRQRGIGEHDIGAREQLRKDVDAELDPGTLCSWKGLRIRARLALRSALVLTAASHARQSGWCGGIPKTLWSIHGD